MFLIQLHRWETGVVTTCWITISGRIKLIQGYTSTMRFQDFSLETHYSLIHFMLLFEFVQLWEPELHHILSLLFQMSGCYRWVFVCNENFFLYSQWIHIVFCYMSSRWSKLFNSLKNLCVVLFFILCEEINFQNLYMLIYTLCTEIFIFSLVILCGKKFITNENIFKLSTELVYESIYEWRK